MKYDYVPKIIDGQWQYCLRVTTEEPVGFSGQTDFTIPVEGAEVHYHTNGKAITTEGDGLLYYWFPLLAPPSMTIDGESAELSEVRAELAEADAALEIAIGGATNEQD